MFASITCPACRHKFAIPEGAMGKAHTCPNCQSLFLAGKSVTEPDVPMKMQPAPPPAMNKTMLGETEPPIRYNCPRCKKPLESPAIEAGTKKPCPACGGRLQIPAPPRPQPALNKTILASDEGNAPAIGAGAAPLPHAGSPPVPAGSTGTAPVAGSVSRRTVAIGAGVAGGVLLLVLLTCVIGAVASGGKSDAAALANAQRELEELKRSIQQKEALMAQQKQFEQELRKQADKWNEEQRARDEKREYQRRLDDERYRDDKEKLAEVKRKRQQEQDDMDRQEKERQAERAKAELEVKARMAALQSQVDAANQQAAILRAQPPPPVYYPWHPRYYWGW